MAGVYVLAEEAPLLSCVQARRTPRVARVRRAVSECAAATAVVVVSGQREEEGVLCALRRVEVRLPNTQMTIRSVCCRVKQVPVIDQSAIRGGALCLM